MLIHTVLLARRATLLSWVTTMLVMARSRDRLDHVHDLVARLLIEVAGRLAGEDHPGLLCFAPAGYLALIALPVLLPPLGETAGGVLASPRRPPLYSPIRASQLPSGSAA